jgi:uncharacterized protein YukE
MVARAQATAAKTPLMTRRHEARQDATYQPMPLQALAKAYQHSSAVPAYLTKPLTVKKEDPGTTGQEPGKDRPKDKPKGAPDAPDTKDGDKGGGDKAKKKDGDKGGKGKSDAGKGGAGPGKEQDKDVGLRKTAAGGGGRGLIGGGGEEGEEEKIFVPPPLPAVESGPASLYRTPLELRDSGPGFLAPAYLRHRPEQPAKALDDKLRNYAERFAEASGAARRVYDQILSRMQALNHAARASEDRRFDARQQSLNQGLEELDEALAGARTLLAEAHAEQLTQLDFIVRATRHSLLRVAGGGAAALDARATRIDSDLSPHQKQKNQIVGMPAAKCAEISAAQAEAEQGLNELTSNPADKLKGTGTAKGKAMAAAQEEAIIRDIKFPVAEAKLRLGKSTKAMTDSVSKQSGPLDAALCPSFCPFEGFKAVLRGEAVKAVWSAHGSSLKKLRDSADSTITSLAKSYSQAETGLIEQHNQLRARLIDGARQRDKAERDQARQQAARGGGSLAALAGAQSRAVIGIDETIARRRRSKEEDFAGAVISYSQGLKEGGLETGRRQSAQIADQAEDGQTLLDKASETGGERFKEGAAQSAAQLGTVAAQSVDANKAMIEGVAESMAKLDDPIRSAFNGFLSRVGSQCDTAIANLAVSLSTTADRVKKGFAGSVDKGEGDDKDKPADPKTDKSGKGGKDGKGKGGKEDGPDPSVAACQAGCPKPEKDSDKEGKDGKTDGGKDGKTDGGKDGTKGDGKGAKDGGGEGGKQEYPDGYIARLKGYKSNPLAEPTVADYVTAMPGIVERDLTKRARTLDKLLGYSNSEPNAVLNELRGLTRLQGRAVEEAYPRGTLRADLDWYLNAGNLVTGVDTRVESIFAARAYLNGDTEAGAVHELNAAVNWSNDSAQIDTVLKSLTPEQMKSMKARFPNELEVIRADLNELDTKVWDKLTSGEKGAIGQAEAWRLEAKIATAHDDYYGEEASDKTVDAVSEAMVGTGGSRLGGAAQFGEMEKSYETRAERQKQERTELLTGYALNKGVVETGDDIGNTLFDAASSQRPYYAYVPGEGPNGAGGKWEPRTKASEAQSRLLKQLIKTGEGSPESRAARMAVELGRVGGGKPDRIRTATEDADLNTSLNNPAAYAAAVERRRKMYELVDQWAPNPKGDGKPRSTEEIQKDVADRLAKPLAYDESKAKYVRSLVTGGPDDPKSMVVRLDYAMDGLGTNNEVLKQTLGSMTRDQFKLVRDEYDKQHPDGPDLLTRLGIRGKGDWWHSETSGDTANELEILSMGIPRNERERAEVSAMEMKQQIRDAGSLGPTVAGPEFAQLGSDYKRLMSVMGINDVGFDKDGEFIVMDANGEPTTMGRFDKNGAFIKQPGFSSDDLALAMTVGKISVENYKAATDAVADAIATALVVTAAIVTTALTGGAAASIWIPVLVTAAAGVASMGVKYAIKGGRYGSEEMMFDLASTIIQAATAGIGAAAGTALRGGGKAVGGLAKSWRMSEQALATAAAGGTKVATKALPALTFGQELFVGALSSGFSGGAMAAINPDSYRSDHYASDILHGIIKGSVSGAVGAGVTRGVMGGVTSLSRGMGARSGAAEALSKGLPLADAQRFATARSRLFGTSALTEVGGRVLGSAASGMATRATEIGYDAAIRKQHVTAGQFWSDIGSAGLQNAIQAFGEGAIDRAIRSRSRSRMREHAFTTRDDIHDYRQRGAQAVVDEGIRRGIIKPPGAPDVPAPGAPKTRPTVSVDEEGKPLPLPRPDEEGGHLPALPANDEDGAAHPAAHPDADADEPVTMLRSAAGPEDDEPRLRTGSDPDDEKTDPVIHIPPPTFPDGVDLKPGMLDSLPEITPGTVVRPADPTDGAQAQRNYELLRARTPGREAMVAFNPTTGHYMVVQGAARSVKPPPEGWVTLRHSHPKVVGGDVYSHFASVLPSGIGGDFSVLRTELDRMPGANIGLEVKRSSVIDIDVNGTHVQTTFEITRKGANYSLSVTLDPPVHGVSSLGPFKGDRVTALKEYAYKARDLTSGGSDFGLGHNKAPKENLLTPGADVPKRTVSASHDEPLTPANRADVEFAAGRVQASIDADAPLPAGGKRSEEELYHALGRAKTPDDAKEVVARMGLVGEPDSMVRLSNVLNDGSIDVDTRARLAKAVLDATRDEMVRANKLEPDDELMMIFHGAPDDQIASYREKGIDMGFKPGGANDDLGMGLYMSQDLRSAMGYHGESGRVIPWIATRKQLGHVVDVRPGSPLRAAWEKFFVSYAGRKGITGDARTWTRPTPKVEPVFGSFGIGKAMRGAVFDMFLQRIANDPSMPQHVRDAAGDPHIILSDLGGPATYGNDRKFVTDQAAVRAQRIADMINEQMGFPRVGPSEAEGEPMLRSADDGPEPAAEVQPLPPKPPAAETETVTPKAPALDEAPADQTPAAPLAKALPPITAAHEDTALSKVRGTGADPIIATVKQLAKLDRDSVMAVLHADNEVDAAAALARFRAKLISQGMSPEQAAARARRLDFAWASIGGRFRTEVGFASGRMTVSTAGLTPKLAAWVGESAVLAYVHANYPDTFQDLHDRFLQAKAGQGGRNRAPNFERFVVKAFGRDPELFGAVGVRGRDNAVLKMAERAHQIEAADVAPRQGPRPPSQSGPILTDPATVSVGMRVDVEGVGRGTVVSVSKAGKAQIHFDGADRPSQGRFLISDGELSVAHEPDPRFDKVPPVHRSDAEMKAQFDKVAEHRKDSDLPVYDMGTGATGTVARIELGGESFHGTNSGLDPANFALTLESRRALFEQLCKAAGLKSDNLGQAKFLSHAEAEAMIRAYVHFGALPEVLELFVDRPTCPSCSKDLIRLARLLGVKEMRIYYKGQSDPPLVRK